ncbi:hypothetical protein HDU80_006540 [Chytriomyces hyalinus]|nr:hypothetical protein HDU80_006540 [Chytriomyces hyalinus]
MGSRPRCPFPECQGISFDNVKGLQAHTRDHHRDGLGDSAIASGASVAGAVAAGGAKRDRDSRMRNSVLGVDGAVHYQQIRGGADGASLSMQEERSGLLNPNGQQANYTELDGNYDSAGGGIANRGSRVVSVQVVPSQSLPHTSSIDESAQNQSQQSLQNRAYMQQQHNTTPTPNSANSTPDSTHMQSGQPARARSGGNILKPYVCTYPNCHKSFAQPAGLRSHTVTHTGDRHFVCKFENCDKRYTTNNRLKIHMRSHTNEKPYVCKHPGCTYAAKQACSLTQHKLTHLNPEEKRAEMEKRARTLPCAECGRVYRTMESLDLHSWKEHGKAGIVGIIVANNGGNGDGGPGRQQNVGGSFEETDARFSEE